jgi:hypothetical protein
MEMADAVTDTAAGFVGALVAQLRSTADSPPLSP